MLVAATIVERPSPHRPGVWAGFVVPDDVVESIAGEAASTRKRLPVVVRFGEYTYASSLTRQDDGWEFIASLEFREKTETKIGDVIDVDIVYDTAERTVEVPDDVVEALDAEPGAWAWWDSMPYSHRREIMLYINDAKRPETRAKRIGSMLERYVGPA